MHRHVFGVTALLAVNLALVPGSAAAQQSSLKDQLVGAWQLASWERIAPDGTKVHAFGTNPKGIVYYGADGRYFLIFTRAELPKVAANDRAKATPGEAKALVDGAIAYSGTYTVDEQAKTINLRIEVTTFPNQAPTGKRQITSITPTELKFTNPTATAGGRVDVTLKRAPAGATN
jgi:hypothetical protein